MEKMLQIITIISGIYIGRLAGLLLNRKYNNNFLIKFIFLIVVVASLYSLFMQLSYLG